MNRPLDYSQILSMPFSGSRLAAATDGRNGKTRCEMKYVFAVRHNWLP